MEKREEILKQLGKELGVFYKSAPYGETILRLEYFVIKNSKKILCAKVKPMELLKAANLENKKISGEIARALKLSQYVEITREM